MYIFESVARNMRAESKICTYVYKQNHNIQHIHVYTMRTFVRAYEIVTEYYSVTRTPIFNTINAHQQQQQQTYNRSKKRMNITTHLFNVNDISECHRKCKWCKNACDDFWMPSNMVVVTLFSCLKWCTISAEIGSHRTSKKCIWFYSISTFSNRISRLNNLTLNSPKPHAHRQCDWYPLYWFWYRCYRRISAFSDFCTPKETI